MVLPHQSNTGRRYYQLAGQRALIITTSQATLDEIDDTTGAIIKQGKATGVYAAEMTEPYYAFLDAGLEVDIASITGGKIPIDKLSLMPLVRTEDDRRFLQDSVLRAKVEHSIPIKDVHIQNYDVVFLSGGWGAAYDFAQSKELSDKLSEAYARQMVLGAVCHGPLGFIGATKPDGSPLVKDVKMTGVTNKQLRQLMVGGTPKHPETELRKAGAKYESHTGWVDMFNHHLVVDEQHLIVTGQNQKAGIAAAQEVLELLRKQARK